MGELAIKPMTLDEFLQWDDGTETYYELIEGFPVAMAPPSEAHSILVVRLVTQIDGGLSGRRPCRAQIEAGVTRPDSADTYFVADIAATCAAIEPRRQTVKDPFLIVEILSPGTERHDRRVKLPVYRQIASVQEILFIASDGLYAELHRRAGARWITEILRGGDARLALASVGIEIPLGDLYEGIAVADAET
ncbi:MAG: Uma2 family endonuclease [Alphaproteobacteria bacterium]